MFGHDFQHNHLRKYVIVFGTLFNDLIVQRKDSAGNIIQNIKVPLAYGPREKALARLEQDPDLNRKVAITLPRMSFEMTSYNYAPERKLNKIHRNVAALSDDKKKLYAAYTPVPYDIGFELNLMTKAAEDATILIEQILPFFTPEWSVTMNLIPEMGWKQDIPIVLNNVSVSDTYEADFETRRALIWNLGFRMKAYMHGPIRQSGAIREANVGFTGQFANGAYANTRSTAVKVKPGLLANGSPTTNAAASVSANSINSTDSYGHIIDFEDYFDGNT